ncbi:dynein axonemal light chain 1-like [Microtus pennsylvanicus]|uniref:dynein axonemal light chain 1-like n=1 Tax=Microtus pennsylvanicus TaxID=10058 RepID=UPI003F6BB1D3
MDIESVNRKKIWPAREFVESIGNGGRERTEEFVGIATSSDNGHPWRVWEPREEYFNVTAQAKATTIKEALSRWEEKTGQRPSEAREIKLYAQIPPIEKMDASLSTLANCEKLSLSTNCIEKIANLNGLKNLRILSLGRNNIKNLNGLEAVGDTLEELWISYNFIEKLKRIHVMKKLKILYMSNNLVKDWAEFVKLAELPCLEDLVFVGNPLEKKHSAEGNWIDEANKRVPKLKKLDGIPVIKQEEEDEN